MEKPKDVLYSPHIEESLVGSCIQQPDLFDRCRALVRPDDLHDQRLRWIWETLERLVDSRITPDVITVCKDLDDHRQLAEIGGESFIAKIVAAPDSSMNAPDYAQIVAHDGLRRRILAAAQDLAKRVFDGKRDVADTLQFALDEFSRIDHAHGSRSDFLKRFTLYSISDALKPRPPIVWRVEKLFREASTYMIVGEAGSKKTWCMLDLAVSVAQGAKWLGLQTTQCPVLFVDEESGCARMSERLTMTIRGHLANEDLPLSWISLSQIDLRNKDDRHALSNLIQDTQAKFVIIDAFVDIMPGADENSVADTQPIFIALRKLAEDTGAAILVVHHTNKLGGYRGSSAIKGGPDGMIIVKSAPTQNLIEFDTEKNRDVAPFLLAAEARFADDQFYLVETDHPKTREDAAKNDQLDAALIEALQDASPKPLSTNQLCIAAGGNKSRAWARIDELVKDGRIRRMDGDRKNTHIYSLL